MKRFFFLAVAATCLLASCNKTEIVPTGELQEISFVAVNKVATKVPVTGNQFLDNDNMAVAAYIVDGTTPNDFFGYTLFQKEGGATYWTGQPARYWPLTTSTINFLAVTEKGGNVDKTTVTFDETSPASGAVVTLAGNDTNDQNDLMYAAGTGRHVQGNKYDAVSMVFKHALAWINFQIKTSTPAYDADAKEGCTIKVNSITLNEAVFNGTLTLGNSQCWTDVANNTGEVTATWAPGAKVNLAVPRADGTTTADGVTLTGDYQLFGNGLLVVPDAYAESFTINYTLTQSDNTANTYNYTYTLPAGKWEMAKKYFYNSNITLTEIEVKPSVTEWDASHADVNTGIEINK